MKLKEQFDYIDNLPEELKYIIQEYTGSEYKDLNERLRNGKKLKTKQEDMVNKLDLMFKLVPPITKTIEVYRGINSHEIINSLSSYVSTTRDKNIAYSFSGKNCCLLKITIPVGSKILPIENISEYKKEKEILLDRFGKIVTISLSDNIYNMLFIPDNSIDINDKKDINEINNKLSIRNWVDRLTGLFTVGELEIYDTVEDVINSYVDLYFKNVPKEAIDESIKILENLYVKNI